MPTGEALELGLREDLRTMRQRIGLCPERVERECRALPWLKVVDAEVARNPQQTPYVAAWHVVRCLVRHQLPDRIDRRILTLTLNLGTDCGDNLKARRAAAQTELSLWNDRTYERRELRAYNSLIGYLLTSETSPCESGPRMTSQQLEGVLNEALSDVSEGLLDVHIKVDARELARLLRLVFTLLASEIDPDDKRLLADIILRNLPRAAGYLPLESRLGRVETLLRKVARFRDNGFLNPNLTFSSSGIASILSKSNSESFSESANLMNHKAVVVAPSPRRFLVRSERTELSELISPPPRAATEWMLLPLYFEIKRRTFEVLAELVTEIEELNGWGSIFGEPVRETSQ